MIKPNGIQLARNECVSFASVFFAGLGAIKGLGSSLRGHGSFVRK